MPTSFSSPKIPALIKAGPFGRFYPQIQQLQKHHFKPISHNPLRFGAVCYSAPLSPQNLQWASAVSTAYVVVLLPLAFIWIGELELPFISLLLVIVSPYQIMRLRGTQEGVVFFIYNCGLFGFPTFYTICQLGKKLSTKVQLLLP